jgi:hypothetical protein
MQNAHGAAVLCFQGRRPARHTTCHAKETASGTAVAARTSSVTKDAQIGRRVAATTEGSHCHRPLNVEAAV